MRTFAEISRAALTANFQAIRRTVGPSVEVLSVVKADAYGHGAAEVARTLEQAGAGWFAVTCIAEGIHLRQNGIRGRILVLADCAWSELNALAEFDLSLMVHTLDQIRELDAWARLREFCPKFHLEIDSGMGRLGLPQSDAAKIAGLLESAPHLRLEGLATHFASAEDFSTGQTEDQVCRFNRLVQDLAERGVRPRFVHMANSAALAYRPETRGSMVRPGLALYGYLMPPQGVKVTPPFRPTPALTWKARVIAVKDFPAGALLGYNATYRTERPMRVGVIAAGYADGLDRRLSNGGAVLAGGRRATILGLISMDVCLVDLSSSRGVEPGSYVTILGQEGDATIDATEVAERCQTIPYEILCGLGRRVPRVYR